MPREDRTAFDDVTRAGSQTGARARPNGHAGNNEHRFRLVRFAAVKLDMGCPYLIKDIIPREGVVVVWGPPKCGKTFWVYDAVMHVALGWPYRDRRTVQGTVVYIACEGERGLAARTEAFRRRNLAEDGADPPFYLLTTRLDLVADIDTLKGDVADQIEDQRCAAIVIDTLNRSIAGSENDPKDMTAYIRAADILREAFRCAVILIHHCGVDGTRPRGFTGLSGAADAQIGIKKDGSGNVVATVELMKDGPEGDVITSRLAIVEVGIDDDGEPVTSCVIEEVEGAAPVSPQPKRLPDAAKIALGTLRKAVVEAGNGAPASNHIPPAARGVDIETWRKFHYVGTATDDQSADARRKGFQRVRQQLQAAGVIGLHADFCWIVADV